MPQILGPTTMRPFLIRQCSGPSPETRQAEPATRRSQREVVVRFLSTAMATVSKIKILLSSRSSTTSGTAMPGVCAVEEWSIVAGLAAAVFQNLLRLEAPVTRSFPVTYCGWKPQPLFCRSLRLEAPATINTHSAEPIARTRPDQRARLTVKMNLPTISDCTGCGLCCLHMGYPSFIGADDDRPAEVHWQQMPTELKKELQHYIASYQIPTGQLDGPCFWYDEKLRVCRHHEHRPNVCRDFRVGSQVCRQWRDHYVRSSTDSDSPGDLRDRHGRSEIMALGHWCPRGDIQASLSLGS